MEVQTIYLLTQRQMEVAEALADVLAYLPVEDRRGAMELALDAVNADG